MWCPGNTTTVKKCLCREKCKKKFTGNYLTKCPEGAHFFGSCIASTLIMDFGLSSTVITNLIILERSRFFSLIKDDTLQTFNLETPFNSDRILCKVNYVK